MDRVDSYRESLHLYDSFNLEIYEKKVKHMKITIARERKRERARERERERERTGYKNKNFT